MQWEQACVDEVVADIFGYHSLQIGMPLLDGLRASRIPHRWRAVGASFVAAPNAGPAPHLLLHAGALPFADNSLDLVLLPHTLEFSPDAHAILREVARVLVPEGQVVISGINPVSLWGLQPKWFRKVRHALIAPWRLGDWLRLLSFEVEAPRFGGYRPALHSENCLRNFAWLDHIGPRVWPILGAGYVVVAIKRVHGMHPLAPPWRQQQQTVVRGVPALSRSSDKSHG